MFRDRDERPENQREPTQEQIEDNDFYSVSIIKDEIAQADVAETSEEARVLLLSSIAKSLCNISITLIEENPRTRHFYNRRQRRP